ncbi:MAG: type IV secretory system conjugative DNA transfer family protein [Candidatus Pacebacteria bacterium]|nr:type IV secretory system conjugative DNA transfer family protein [Candidatus Paceibacterota bacterium]MBP9840451.1 type IV secretory system conjugative DNA transfer family protein [Candidatus Paceibacterota bacterium]
MEGTRQLTTPEEELAYLRAQVEEKERELAGRAQEAPRNTLVHERILHHRREMPETVLAPSYKLPEAEVEGIALDLDPDDNDATMAELQGIMEEKGIKNALSVLEKLRNPHLDDDFHRFLVQYVVAGMQVKGLGEREPAWKALHMTLYEVILPEPGKDSDAREKTLKELISSMEQFYAGMLSVGDASASEPGYFSMELAVPANRPELLFYVAVPNGKRALFEQQLLATFPNANIRPQPNDYNIFSEDGVAVGASATLADKGVLPLKDYADFDYDPLNTVLGAFAKIEKASEGAALQVIIERDTHHLEHYRRILGALRRGESKDRALSMPETFVGEAAREIGSALFPGSRKWENEVEKRAERKDGNQALIEQIEKKIAAPIVKTTLRLMVSSPTHTRAESGLADLEAAFNQFTNTVGNKINWNRFSGTKVQSLFHAFSYRLPAKDAIPLSLREVTSLYHFPPEGISSTPQLRQSRFTAAAAPLDLPDSGTYLGDNEFRGRKTAAFLSPEDRMRHLYVVGQTGTGKSVFMRNLAIQDIKAGNGVCFIDPHGNDILDILAAVPPERYEDVIYFDPANLARPFGLNLLEYDASRPEQKTFIVNEILAIFRRLYGDVPESMGPAFEQYFRNSTLLVMEDPASGSTLLDIARVLSNKEFRDLKLSRSNNPVINQFWNEIATKAEGEASLQNIVPYITNKFDDFTANDFMRPIVGQQESSFKFREVMDNKKILLVNLSKGRLGERNANLLGLILVGKIFMAALSRADNPRADYAPFYLYIDEFQNITTDSIPGILSEARKYRLSLTMAHQFLAQVDEKVRDAVFGNVGSMAVFRVGEEDGEYFEKQFAPVFSALDFVNIENYNAYVRLLARGVPQKPFNIKTPPPAATNPAQVDDLRELSALVYGRDRTQVENLIRSRYMS